MKIPPWLVEFHRQWQKARGEQLRVAVRPFSRAWEKLLDDAGLRTSAERDQAVREAEAYEAEGRFKLRRHRYRRYLLESVALAPEAETWLVEVFGGIPAQDRRNEALAVIARFHREGHPRWPESWETMCEAISAAFEEGRGLPPFAWKNPEALEALLVALKGLTVHEWPEGRLVRDASMTMGFESKYLEENQRVLESALAILFGEETSLEALGLSGSQSRVVLHGPLRLHFEDGHVQHFEHLCGEYTISLSDLQRAAGATTSAGRILSIENGKTPFRQASVANRLADTLLIATSFPNAATRRLLEILPPSLSHYHFGDTDPSGYAILRSLRGIGRRAVGRFLMDWQDLPGSRPLTEHDRRMLPGLKESPLLEDCRRFLAAMEAAGRKGRFEQEAHGAPDLAGWPFWKAAGNTAVQEG